MDEIRTPISFCEYSAFHTTDRALYFALAFHLWRNPIQSIEILALWILFERLKLSNNIVKFMLTQEPSMLAIYVDEALTCLLCIKEEGFLATAETRGIPLTSILLGNNISPLYFSKNRAFFERRLENIIYDICTKAFPDMLNDAIMSHTAYDSMVKDMVAAAAFTKVNRPFMNSPREDRTMFATFSRGYPVDEAEVRVMFKNFFGVDCVETYYMQKRPSPGEQPLYARIIFTNTEVVNNILNGKEKAKLLVNKKHLWLRKYIPKPRPTPA